MLLSSAKNFYEFKILEKRSMRDKLNQDKLIEGAIGEGLSAKNEEENTDSIDQYLNEMTLNVPSLGEIQSLRNENDKLRFEILQLKETIKEKETEHLREIGETKQVNYIQVKDLQARNIRYEHEEEKWSEIEDLQTENMYLKKALERLSGSEVSYKFTIDKLGEDFKSSESALSVVKNTLNDLKKDKKILENRISQQSKLMDKLSLKADERDKFVEKLDQYQRVFFNLSQVIQSLKIEFTLRETDLNESLANEQRKKEDLNTKLESKQEKNEAKESKICQLKEELERLKTAKHGKSLFEELLPDTLQQFQAAKGGIAKISEQAEEIQALRGDLEKTQAIIRETNLTLKRVEIDLSKEKSQTAHLLSEKKEREIVDKKITEIKEKLNTLINSNANDPVEMLQILQKIAFLSKNDESKLKVIDLLMGCYAGSSIGQYIAGMLNQRPKAFETVLKTYLSLLFNCRAQSGVLILLQHSLLNDFSIVLADKCMKIPSSMEFFARLSSELMKESQLGSKQAFKSSFEKKKNKKNDFFNRIKHAIPNTISSIPQEILIAILFFINDELLLSDRVLFERFSSRKIENLDSKLVVNEITYFLNPDHFQELKERVEIVKSKEELEPERPSRGFFKFRNLVDKSGPSDANADRAPMTPPCHFPSRS